MLFFFFNDTATTEIYTLSLHDALPIYQQAVARAEVERLALDHVPVLVGLPEVHGERDDLRLVLVLEDRKSTRLNSSHANISYAVFCLKKKKKNNSILLVTCLLFYIRYR